MTGRWWAAGGLLALAVVVAACDEKLKDLTGPTPELAPTFSSIQQNIFESTDGSGRPACTNCHTANGRTPAGGLNLEHQSAYAALVSVASTGKSGAVRVVPGDPANSYIVQKLEGTAGIVGSRMPRNSAVFLTDGQMRVIRRWIEQGARQD
jgi:hypothetical protein